MSIKNFAHNLSFASCQPFLQNEYWQLPAAIPEVQQSDSFAIYPILTYSQPFEKSGVSVNYYVVSNSYNFENYSQLLADYQRQAVAKQIRMFNISLTDLPASMEEQSGGVLAVKKRAEQQRDAPLEEGCEIVQIEWYWQTWVDGVLIDEEYLFTTNEIMCPPGGGGGGSSGDTTITSTANPCDSVNKIANNAEFKAKLDSLKNKVSGNREHAYFFTNTESNSIEETASMGELNSLGVDYDLSPNVKIDGLMHNHFFVDGRSVSIFSQTDIADLIKLYKDGKIRDAYSLTLASQSGNEYMLTIQNQEKFASFAQTCSQEAFLKSFYNMHKILPDKTGENNVAANEANFLKFLQVSESGLKFFKKDATLSNWNPLKHSQGQVIADPCN